MLGAFPEADGAAHLTPAGDALPRRVRVVGIGNRDRGDDGIGPRVADLLAGRLPPDVAVVTCNGDLLSLLDGWRGVDALVCVDAAASLGEPGRIHRIDAGGGDLAPAFEGGVSSHAFGLGAALALAGALGQLPARVVVYAVEGGGFDAGAPLSPPVAAAAGPVAERIAAEISGLLREPTG